MIKAWMALFLFLPLFASATTPMVRGALDLRFERDESQMVKPKTLRNWAVGIFTEQWFAEVEYSSFHETTGNATLSLKRSYESALVWGYWVPTDLDYFAPYLGLGLGGIRQTVATTLLGETDTDKGTWDPTLGAGLGLRFIPKGRFWLSAEGRLYKNPYLDPDPQLGALLKVGFIFR